MQQATEQLSPSSNYEEDFFDMYFSLVEDSSESPFLYHRWTLISAVSALLGRQAVMPFGHDKIYPNMFVCLMGNAGSRKSSAIGITRKLLSGAGYETFSREKTSSQKFLADLGEGFDKVTLAPKSKNSIAPLEDDEILELEFNNSKDYDPDNEEPSEVYITAGELEDFLGQSDGQFISLLTNMWDNLDYYSHGKMTSDDIFIHKPTINLIGGATPSTFANIFPPEAVGQGILSRMLLVYGGGARKKITMPPAPDPELITFFTEHMRQIKEQVKGFFTITPEALKVFDTVYQFTIDLEDNRLDSYLNRRHVHYYKLCMVLAACELTMEITEEIAIKANTILHWTESFMPKALGTFGKSITSNLDQVILEALEKHPNGIPSAALYPSVSQDFKDIRDYTLALQDLTASQKIGVVKGGNLVAIKKEAKESIPYVDFSLLREYRDTK